MNTRPTKLDCSKIYFKLLICTAVLFNVSNVFAQEQLNKSLKPSTKQQEENLFEDMVVIQNKAMNKSGRFLLSTYGALDFSDGPYTMYSLNVNPGYAISDFWEVYLCASPFYITQERDIVQKAKNAGFIVTGSKAKYSYGAEILWSPLYGKDSLGSRKIVRSDTFVKFGVHNIKYQIDNGLSFQLALGKTYFMTKYLGIRGAVSGNYTQTSVGTSETNVEKSYKFFATVEAGAVVYF